MKILGYVNNFTYITFIKYKLFTVLNVFFSHESEIQLSKCAKNVLNYSNNCCNLNGILVIFEPFDSKCHKLLIIPGLKATLVKTAAAISRWKRDCFLGCTEKEKEQSSGSRAFLQVLHFHISPFPIKTNQSLLPTKFEVFEERYQEKKV